MPREIEMKFKVASHAPLVCALRRLGARPLESAIQRDRYFDTPDHRLLRGDCGLRLRYQRVRLSGKVRRRIDAMLTYKGPREGRGGAKARDEYETGVDNPAAVEAILRGSGLSAMLTVEKRRVSYRLGRCRVELDKLPILGLFVEIEGPSRKEVQAAREKLGLVPCRPIRDHYIALFQKASPMAVKEGEITFSRFKGRRQ
jgi:predicted adenylyl cyclase CyaB